MAGWANLSPRAIIEASSTMNNASFSLLYPKSKVPPPPSMVRWRYIHRWMVCAAEPLFRANTLAARPVGASSTTGCSIRLRNLTMAPARVVLPVPAEPRSIMSVRSFLLVRKWANVSITRCCPSVGTCSISDVIWNIISSVSNFLSSFVSFFPKICTFAF